MLSEWTDSTLGALGEFRNGVNFNREQEGSGIPVLKVKDFGDSFLAPLTGLDELSSTRFAIRDEQLLQVGDTVIIRSNGNPTLVGRCLFVARAPRPTTFSGFCIRFRPDPKLLEPRFAAYFVRSPFCRQRFYAFGSGTGIQNLNQTVLSNLPLRLPPLAEQKAIAQTLGALDEKIDVNLRMNQTLEMLAHALFRAWFVDFEPVRAKAEGRRPNALDEASAGLFPSRLIHSESGDLPEHWSWRPLDQTARFLNGLALQKYPPSGPDSLPVIKITQLRQGSSEGADRASAAVPGDYIVEDGDLLFSWSGSLLIALWAGGRGALNQHLFKVIPANLPKWFVHHWCLHHLTDFQSIAAGKATTMGHIQRHHLTQALTVVPSEEILALGDRVIGPLWARWLLNALENRTLVALRDTLLPRLLSGELGVGAHDYLVAATA